MMIKCRYLDCGWCYAPKTLITTAVQGACDNQEKCPAYTSKWKEVNKHANNGKEGRRT